MTGPGRLGCAVQLKFMQTTGRFPEHDETPAARGVTLLAAQLGIPAEHLSDYDGLGRQGRRHRRLIRNYLGFRPTGRDDLEHLAPGGRGCLRTRGSHRSGRAGLPHPAPRLSARCTTHVAHPLDPE
ncbi:DUF4158 domain-containing protein, partial [Thiocystis violacea]|uniref:DUF4158 domain-containing protein n=1 Tax=Thiocystis violacea TaxID=13725 RepID=UPI0031FA2ABA